jgi:hypothetical protein
MNIKELKRNDTDSNALYTLLECVDKEINFNALLDKYGPEGLYMIADKLKELADEDMRNVLDQCNNAI